MPIRMTRSQYEATYGQPPPIPAVPVKAAPIRMTHAEYMAKYGGANTGVINKIGQGFKNIIEQRAENLATGVEAQVHGQQTLPETVLQTVGQAAGAATDIVGAGLSAVTPGFIKKPLEKGAQAIAGTKPVQVAFQSYQKWSQSHPRAARDLESIINIASLIPIGKGAEVGTRAIEEKIIPTITKTSSLIGETKKELTSKVSSLIKGKSLQEILSTPKSEVYKLSATERKAWFNNIQEQISMKHERISQTIQKDLQSKVLSSQTEAEQLQRQLATATRDKVIELRPKILQMMGKQSQVYRKLVKEELTPHANKVVKTIDINNFIDNKFVDNPDMSQAIKLKLGTIEKVRIPTEEEPILPKVRQQTTLGELYTRSQSLKQKIGKPLTRVFTPDEKLTDDSISTLTDFMKQQGVDLKNARQFWAKYAPIRNQLVSEAKPFIQARIQTKTFASTLMRVAKGVDVNNENFINEVESLIGEPISKDSKSIVAKMNVNKKEILTNKLSAESAKLDNQMAKESALKSLSTEQFEIERRARFRDVVKNLIKYVVPGIIGEEVIRRL